MGRRTTRASHAAAAAAAAERDVPAFNGTADLSRTSSSQNKAAKTPRPNDSTALALTNQFADMSLSQTGGSQDLDALVASMESRIVTNVASRFDSVFNQILKQMQSFTDSRETAFATSQTSLLQMVSDVLNDNTETVLRNLIINQINDNVVPSIHSAVDKAVSEQLSSQASAQLNAIQKEMQKLLPGAVAQTMQRPDIIKGISDKVSHNVNAHVESQVAASLENIAPVIAKMAAQTVHGRITADVNAQINDAFARLEERRRSEDDKLDRLIAQTTDLSNAISSLAASQAAVQNELFTLKQSLREQQRDREPQSQPHMHVPLASHGSAGPVNKPGPSRDIYPPQHQQQLVQQPSHMHAHHQHSYGNEDQRVMFQPTSQDNRQKLELSNMLETIDTLMRNENYDDAILRWLQAPQKAEEVFQQVLYKYDPVRLSNLQPLLLLSVGATITNDFSRASEKIMDKIRWLELVVFSLNQRIPELDDQVREVTPKIMSLIKARSEQLMMDIGRVAPQDPSLKTLNSLAHVAARIMDAVQGSRHASLGHQGPSY
jgi:hypothetical protein